MKNETPEYAFAMLDQNGSYTQYGLTKREYFAGLAMQGRVMNSRSFDNDFGQIAELSVSMADTLIDELNK